MQLISTSHLGGHSALNKSTLTPLSLSCLAPQIEETSASACSIEGGCKAVEKIYAITSEGPHSKKLHRLTFSKSLAELICRDSKYSIEKMKFRLGRRLEENEKSTNGLYALVATGSAIVLRISLNYDIAQLHCDYKYRYLSQVWLESI